MPAQPARPAVASATARGAPPARATPSICEHRQGDEPDGHERREQAAASSSSPNSDQTVASCTDASSEMPAAAATAESAGAQDKTAGPRTAVAAPGPARAADPTILRRARAAPAAGAGRAALELNLHRSLRTWSRGPQTGPVGDRARWHPSPLFGRQGPRPGLVANRSLACAAGAGLWRWPRHEGMIHRLQQTRMHETRGEPKRERRRSQRRTDPFEAPPYRVRRASSVDEPGCRISCRPRAQALRLAGIVGKLEVQSALEPLSRRKRAGRQ